jgi:hypothetical protein
MTAKVRRSTKPASLLTAAALTGLLATACGGGQAAPTLPIAPGGRSATGGAAEAAMDAAMPDMLWQPVTYVAGAGLPALGGERPVYRLRPGGEQDLQAVADALGIAGDVVREDGALRLTDGDHVLESWDGTWFGYYSGTGIGVRVEDAVCSSDGECEEPAPPERPADLPTAAEAGQLAREVLGATGPSLDGAEVIVDDGITAWFVRVRYQVGGMFADGFEAYVSVGPDGVIDAYGPLGEVEQVGTYPTISTSDAIVRLNEGWGVWAARDIAMGGAEGTTVEDGAGAPGDVGAPDEVATGEATAPAEPPTTVDPAEPPATVKPDVPATEPATEIPWTEPEPITLTLTGVEWTLTSFWSWDGSGMYLLPAYRYTADDGSQPTVPAVPDDVIAPPPAPTEGVDSGGGGGVSGSEVKPEPAPEIVPEETAVDN